MDKFLIVNNPMVPYSPVYVLAMGKNPQLFRVQKREEIEEIGLFQLATAVEVFFPDARKRPTNYVITCMDWTTTTRAQDAKTLKRLVRWWISYCNKFPHGHKVEY